jgi:hypothetical protein
MRKPIVISADRRAGRAGSGARDPHHPRGVPQRHRRGQRQPLLQPAYQTLGPNGEVIAHFNHAQRLYLIPY